MRAGTYAVGVKYVVLAVVLVLSIGLVVGATIGAGLGGALVAIAFLIMLFMAVISTSTTSQRTGRESDTQRFHGVRLPSRRDDEPIE